VWRPKIERIYISQDPFPFPRPLQRNPSFGFSTMGRRKIEIQPITVRFFALVSSLSNLFFRNAAREEQIRNLPKGSLLSHPPCISSHPLCQRKNGLFKKAYELGVLCSVDVAVIVFDNKQGGPRLYQYGSDDVITIVERAMGVRPTHPSFFSSRSPCSVRG